MSKQSEDCGMLRVVVLIGALLPGAALAEEAAVDWKSELERGRKALAGRDYAEAFARFQAALGQAENAGDESGALEALRGGATSARLGGRLEEAERWLSRAVETTARLRGETSLELASAWSELAALERSRGARQEALATLRDAVKIRERRADGPPEELVRDLTGVAMLEMALEQPKCAQQTLLRALAVWEAAIPADNLQLLPVLDGLAGLYRDATRYEEAEPLYRRALLVREAALGPDSPELLSTLDSLAYVYFGQKKFAEAETFYQRLLALWETSAGPEHPMVALTLDKLAEFYAFQHRYAEAEKAASAALAVRTGAHVASLNQTGRILLMEAKLAEAEDLYRRAIEIGDLAKASDEALDPLLRIYAKVLRELQHPDEAAALEKRVKDALLRKADREGRRPSPVPR